MFFLLSGSAASGKTTLARRLKGQIENLVCHDHDEKRWTPDTTRAAQLEEWVQLALQHQSKGQDFLLTSHSPLGELLACPSAIELSGIAAGLLDCHDTVRIQRMWERGVDPKWPPSQHLLNWASWHRMHAWDSQWEQAVITEGNSAEHDYSRWTAWQQGDPRWQVDTIDSTTSDVDAVIEQIAAWTRARSSATPQLSSSSQWWQTSLPA